MNRRKPGEAPEGLSTTLRRDRSPARHKHPFAKYECGSTASHQSSRPVGFSLSGHPVCRPPVSLSPSDDVDPAATWECRHGKTVRSRRTATRSRSRSSPQPASGASLRMPGPASATPALRAVQIESAVTPFAGPCAPATFQQNEAHLGYVVRVHACRRVCLLQVGRHACCATPAPSTTFVPRIAEQHATERTLA